MDSIKINEKILKIPDRLSKLSITMETSCQNKEQAFLKLGEKLQEAHTQVDRLTKEVFEVTNQIETISNQGIFSNVDSIIIKSLDGFSDYREEVHANLTPVYTIIDHLRQLHTTWQQIEAIARHLYPIALNMIVESVRSNRAYEEFQGIGNEIKDLSNKVNRFKTEIQKTSEKARNNIISTCDSTIYDLSNLSKLVDEGRLKIQESINKTNQLISFSHTILDKAGHHSESANRQIGEIVMGIQLHDSIRQRIEHIGKSLNDAKELYLESIPSPNSQGQLEEKLKQIYVIVNLQVAQLKQIISDVDSVHQITLDAFDKIADEMTQLASELITIDEITKGKKDDPLTGLNEILIHLQQLFENGNALIQKLQKIPEFIFAATTELSNYIKQIQILSQDTQNKALNAMVSTMRLGNEGKSLNVLAQEMKGLSIELKDLVTNVLDALESISTEAHRIEDQHHDYKTKTDNTTSAHITIASAIEEISQINMQFNENTKDIFANADELKRKIEHTKTNLSFFAEYSFELKKQVGELEDICRLLMQYEGLDRSKLEITEKIKKRYTMQKERHVDKSTTDSPADFVVDDEIKSNKKDSHYLNSSDDHNTTLDNCNDFGDNVELF